MTAAVLATGCSTLEVKEGLVSDASPSVSAFTTKAKISVDFVPDLAFLSFGPPGIPAVPVQIKSGEPKELHLRVRFGFTGRHDFALANAVCLTTPSADVLCSSRVTLNADAAANGQGTSPQWQRWSFDISPSYIAEHGIDQDVLPGYSKDPRWNLLHVTLIYSFVCAAQCPSRVHLNGERLISIDHTAISLGSPDFHRAKLSSYQFATDPGP